MKLKLIVIISLILIGDVSGYCQICRQLGEKCEDIYSVRCGEGTECKNGLCIALLRCNGTTKCPFGYECDRSLCKERKSFYGDTCQNVTSSDGTLISNCVYPLVCGVNGTCVSRKYGYCEYSSMECDYDYYCNTTSKKCQRKAQNAGEDCYSLLPESCRDGLVCVPSHNQSESRYECHGLFTGREGQRCIPSHESVPSEFIDMPYIYKSVCNSTANLVCDFRDQQCKKYSHLSVDTEGDCPPSDYALCQYNSASTSEIYCGQVYRLTKLCTLLYDKVLKCAQRNKLSMYGQLKYLNQCSKEICDYSASCVADRGLGFESCITNRIYYCPANVIVPSNNTLK
ncbi:hypothetical protein DLAC_03477 [Tieghemostelium lacteum]|uniref:Uncharacterized protein n=1 Tax=Tieghemostelium lacteum TaxID=361077 RepID=A0A152A1J6_TIELA|nr:hypothetical protein DLAC_03477 [Tieghemostelium lacteum]|eukprot:KYQ99986.1 hypothetical protein DLAC_03477 [Tieghemostelium lacteum]